LVDVSGSDTGSVQNIYTMPDYSDALAKARPRRPVDTSANGGPGTQVKWRDSSKHSSLRHHGKEPGAAAGVAAATAGTRHKDIYNEYITQKQSLGYHHHAAAVPSVVAQTQK
jgi:hypothetical protein